MGTLEWVILILVLLFLFGGGGFYWSRRRAWGELGFVRRFSCDRPTPSSPGAIADGRGADCRALFL